jgi:hypothetical protein
MQSCKKEQVIVSEIICLEPIYHVGAIDPAFGEDTLNAPIFPDYYHFKTFFPSVFTPNNDGLNDYFHFFISLPTENVEFHTRLIIYKNERAVWSTSQYSHHSIDPYHLQWDGRDQDGLIHEGLYDYILLIYRNGEIESTSRCFIYLYLMQIGAYLINQAALFLAINITRALG